MKRLFIILLFVLETISSQSQQFGVNGTNIFYLDGATGNLLWNTDGRGAIGATSANRPASVSTSGAITAGTSLKVGNAAFPLYFSSIGVIYFTSDGVMRLMNNAEANFTRLQFGGTTTNFPSLTTVTNAPGLPYIAATDATGAGYIKLVSSGNQGFKQTTLTDATETSFCWIAIGNTNRVSGTIFYEVGATDGTDNQGLSGECKFTASAKGTTVTAQLADVQTPTDCSTGSIAVTLGKNVATNNVVAFTVNSDLTGITTTNHWIKWHIVAPGLFTVNPL